MNRTPPRALPTISLVFGAVCPTYWPTRSSRVAVTRWPRRRKPRPCSRSPIRCATVVLPVPGLPVKHMCSVGRSTATPKRSRTRSTTRSAASSASRSLTGARPTSSRSSASSTSSTPAPRRTSSRSTVASAGGASSFRFRASASAAVSSETAADRPEVPNEVRPSAPAIAVAPGVAVPAVALPRGTLGGVGVHRVADLAVTSLLAVQAEARFVGGAVDQEGQGDGLPAEARVVGDDPHVALRVLLAAGADLVHHRGRVGQVEHRQSPHVPVRVAGMRVVGGLDRDRPLVAERVVDLEPDLVVGQVGQEREGSLGDPHGVLLYEGVGVASTVSVEA